MSAATDAQRQARSWVRENAKSCPCCGAAVLVVVEGSEGVHDTFRRLAGLGARIAIVTAEEAEADIAEQAYRPIDPIGGPIGEG